MEHRKTKQDWMRPSLNPMGPRKAAGPDYKPKAPWEQQSDELVANFEQNLGIMDADVKSPWDHGSFELQTREKELRRAAEYKYDSLFEVPPMTAQQEKQIADYKMNPPFQCNYNMSVEPIKSARKLNPDKNPATRKPWTYGDMAAAPVTKKIFTRPSTSLWSVSTGDQGAQPDMAMSGDPILDSLRAQLMARGAAGIAGLAKKFRIMDDSGDGKLDMAEFCKGMKECDVVDVSDKALKHLFRYFDRDDSGTIQYDEFLVGIRGVMNARRKAMVEMAFKVLDSDGSGAIDINDILGKYNASAHPDFIAGRRSEREILKEFVQSFEVGRNKDGIITPKEFEDYYANLSASVDDDDYFELMVRNAWHISGGTGWAANTTNRRVLVRHIDGKETVEEIKNDLGIRAKDTNAMVSRLQAQGIAVGTINLSGLTDMKNQVEAKDYYLKRPQPVLDDGMTGSRTLAGVVSNENRSSNANTHMKNGLQAAGGRGPTKPVSLGASVRY